MSAGDSSNTGLVDLEKELTCSICTELLYQPLTLLDCLHTFCGSCLKEWFSWQATSSSSTGRRPRLTCPSCRASVRDTRHDAKVATLLDLFLQVNPNKARPAEEKAEIDKKYRHGENVLEAPSSPGDRAADDQDQRLLAEVREMSLRDTGGRNRRPRTGSSRSRPSERPTVSSSRERRLEEARRRRRAERQLAAPPPPRTAAELASRESRQIEHQSSLRSLLSSSDGDSAIEEEILRQITEEGLLDGIDLRNLSPAQEDELSERIADAYRRRFLSHYMTPQRPQNTDQNRRGQTHDGPGATQRTAVRRTRSRSPTRNEIGSSQSLMPAPSPQVRDGSAPRAVSSERETRRRRTSPIPRTGPSISSDAVITPTTRSSADIPRPPRSSLASLPVVRSHRRATSTASATERRTLSDGQRRQARSRSTDHRTQMFQQTGSPVVTASPTSVSDSPSAPTSRSNTGLQDLRPRQDIPDSPLDRRITTLTSSRPSSSRSEVSVPPEPRRYPEPSVACERCGKQDIQYEVYKHCNTCSNGNYNVCLGCYRAGNSCLHWFGFGFRAQVNFQRKFPPNQEAPMPGPPHVLISRKYLRPSPGTVQQGREGADKTSTEDPSQRLQEGMFCDMCHAISDDCYWKCLRCNDGEWGFCNRCVNRGHSCTHPLLPVTRIQSDAADMQHPNIVGSSAALTFPLVPGAVNYRALTISATCNMCTYPIPPSTTRFHCPECNDGDHDICTNCYLKLCASSKISKENGRNGWRRCPSGHRMIIVGFEDREDGQRRVIVKGLVGGFAMRDTLDPSSPTSPSSPQNFRTSLTDPEASPPPPVRQDSGNWTWKDGTDTGNTGQRRRINRSRHHWTSGADPTKQTSSIPTFPPSGGIGVNCLAIWSCYPDPEDTDEILFPRGAIITEAENINDDWLWGCYAGQKGLFPGSYVRVLEQTGAGVN